jgi:hypothetical protein
VQCAGPVLTAVNEAMRQAPIRRRWLHGHSRPTATPRQRPRSLPSAGRRLALEQVCRYAAKGGREAIARSWAWVTRCTATSIRRPSRTDGRADRGQMSSTPTKTIWSSAGMQAAVRPEECAEPTWLPQLSHRCSLYPAPASGPGAAPRQRLMGKRLLAVSDSRRRHSRPAGRRGWWCAVTSARRRVSATHPVARSAGRTGGRHHPDGRLCPAHSPAPRCSSIPGWSARHRVRWGCFGALPKGCETTMRRSKPG